MKISMYAKVGLVTILAICVLATMILWRENIFLTRRGYQITGSFLDVGGLIEGAEVRYRGYRVGRVMRIAPKPHDIKVAVLILPRLKIPVDSHFRVAFDGLIGQKYLDIIPGVSEKILKPKSMITGISAMGIVDFIDTGVKNLEESKKILESVSNITGDPSVQKMVRKTIANTEITISTLRSLVGSLNRIAVANEENVQVLVTSLSDAAQRLQVLVDITSSFLADEETKASLQESLNRLGAITADVGKITDSIQKITGDPEIIADVRGIIKDTRVTIRNFDAAIAEFRIMSRKASKALDQFAK